MKDTPSAGRPAVCLPDAFADRRMQDTKKIRIIWPLSDALRACVSKTLDSFDREKRKNSPRGTTLGSIGGTPKKGSLPHHLFFMFSLSGPIVYRHPTKP